MSQALDKTAIKQAQADEKTAKEEAQAANPEAHAAMQGYMAQLKSNDLSDLTQSQRSYIENLQAIERANPKATPQDIAMAISVLLWEGRIWDRDGKAADVTSPGGVPLVLDYKGGQGYHDVKMGPEQEKALREQRTLTDKQGKDSGVAHTFPAVASMAGREDTMLGSYNAKMVTSGGDAIQDLAQIIVEQKLEGTFREAEKRDNERAVAIAEEYGSRPLSESLIEHFRKENLKEKRADA